MLEKYYILLVLGEHVSAVIVNDWFGAGLVMEREHWELLHVHCRPVL